MKNGKLMSGFAGGVAAGVVATALAMGGFAGAAENCVDQAQLEANKKVVVDFYNAALNEKNWEKAESMIGETYIQHNPHAKTGREGIRNHVMMLKEKFPKNHGDIKRVIAEGDLVALHVHNKRTPDARGNAVVDILRVKDGKVVEHWDVVQAIPEESMNDNTMF